MNAEDFYSNLGLHCKLDEKFAIERESVEREHRNRMVKMFKPAMGENGAGVPGAVPGADAGAAP